MVRLEVLGTAAASRRTPAGTALPFAADEHLAFRVRLARARARQLAPVPQGGDVTLDFLDGVIRHWMSAQGHERTFHIGMSAFRLEPDLATRWANDRLVP